MKDTVLVANIGASLLLLLGIVVLSMDPLMGLAMIAFMVLSLYQINTEEK